VEMSLMVSIAMLSLATFSYLHIKRDFFHPAVVFPSVWAVTTLSIGLAKSFGYFQISVSAQLIFITGNILFVIGALAVKVKPNQRVEEFQFNLNFRKIVWFCLGLHIVIAPLAWREMSQIAGGIDDIFIAAYRLRAQSVSGEENVGIIVGNYLLVGYFFLPLLLIGWMKKKVNIRMFIALALPWIFLNIISAGRAGLISIILSLIYIYGTQGGKISSKVIFTFLFSTASVLVIGNLLVGKIDADIDSAYLLIIKQSIRGFFDYFLQGPILFSEYLNKPSSIKPTWDALIFPCYVLEKIKLCTTPFLHQGYMNFSSNDVGNVYSIFFSIYPKYDFFGILFIIPIYGLWAAFHHARRYKNIFHTLLSSYLYAAIMLSFFSDRFGPNIYFFLKIFILYTVVSFAFKKT
jgi:oligosaccharide repeat unit polymerase